MPALTAPRGQSLSGHACLPLNSCAGPTGGGQAAAKPLS